MKEVLYIRISLSEAELLVREFDGNLDGRLSSQEFYQFCLPATSLSLRDIALNRGNAQSYSYKFAPLLTSTLNQMGDLIQRELRFLRTRAELKRELMNHYDFLKSRFFNLISRDKVFITVDDQIAFLEYNGFRPTTEDLESILRRCDHSGDQLISYTEFSEMTAFVENLSTSDILGVSLPSSHEKRPERGYSPIEQREAPGLGGSADRYERANTFGGSPLAVEK
jgi:Ca2+-binding EF-hand superfamily protein